MKVTYKKLLAFILSALLACAVFAGCAEDAGNGDVNLVSIEDDDEYDRVADLVEDEFFSEIDYDDMKGNE